MTKELLVDVWTDSLSDEQLGLKDEIMGCNGVLDDLRVLSWRLDDTRDRMDPEDIINVVRGLETLYDLKFRKLWEAFNKITEK